jgi:hypothetical protein
MSEIDPVVLKLFVENGEYKAKLRETTVLVDSELAKQGRAASVFEARATGSFKRIGAAALAMKASVGAALIGGIAAAFAGGAVAFSVAAVQYYSSIKKTSDALGIGAKDFQEYRYAAQKVGVTQDELEGGFKSLTDQIQKASLGANAPNKVFKVLGINIRDASGMVRDAADVFPELANRLNAIPDPAQRAATAALLLGDNAAALKPLLDEGGAGIDNLRDAAERLGIVLSDKQIQEADILAKKLDDLRLVISADITAAVVSNADAILTLAGSFLKLTDNVLSSISALKNYYALGKLRDTASSPADQASAAKTLLGTKEGRDYLQSDIQAKLADNANRRSSRQRLIGSIPIVGSMYGAATPQSDAALDREFKALNRQRNAVIKAEHAAAKLDKGRTTPASGNAPDVSRLLAPKPSSAHGKKPPRDLSQENDARFQNTLQRLSDEYLSAVADATGAVQDRVRAEQARVETERASFEREVRADEKLSDIQQKGLIAASDKLAAEKQRAILADEARRREQAALDAMADTQATLRAEEDLAPTREARLVIERRILDSLEEQERKQLEIQIAAGQIADAETARANLAKRQSARREGTERDNESPLASYSRKLNETDIRDRVEEYAVDELQHVQDGIRDALTKKLGIKDPFLAGLLDLFIQQVIMKPLANAMSNASGGAGGGGGFFSTLITSIGSIFGRASGGYVGPGQMVRVNEGASAGRVEGFQPSGSGHIIPLGRMNATPRGAGTTVIHAPRFNLAGAIITPQLYADMQRISDQSAAKAGTAAYKQSMRDAPAAISFNKRFGVSKV